MSGDLGKAGFGEPGLQGQEHSEVRATIYRRGSQELNIPATPLHLDGRTDRDEAPSIVGCQISQSLGQPGAFHLSLRLPPDLDMLDICDDDDWVDIEIGRDGVFWHVMRGLIDEVRCSTQVTGAGVTARNYMVAGQSFQKIWTQTPMWFSSLFAEDFSLSQGQGSTQDTALLGIGLNVPGTIASFLYSYTNRVAQQKRTGVLMPPSMPGVGASRDFSQTWLQDDVDFDDSDAPRVNFLVNGFAPSQSVWDVATGWSDPFFCEMFTALLPAVPTQPSGRTFLGDKRQQRVASSSAIGALGQRYEKVQYGLPTNGSVMTLIVRNKPFINVDAENSAARGFSSPWFSLPTLVLSPQSLVSLDIGRNGYERVNAFFFSSQVLSAIGEAPTDAKAIPTWNVDDMRVHGMRPLDVVSQYLPDRRAQSPGLDDLSQAIRLRARARDHAMANHLYLSGSAALGRCFPEAQVGTRMHVNYGRKGAGDFKAYIEQVTHAYSPTGGWKTVLGFTRGYRGTDADHLRLLREIRSGYTVPII